MNKRKSKIPAVSYEYVQDAEQGRHLDLAFNILFEEVMRIKKLRNAKTISQYKVAVVSV